MLGLGLAVLIGFLTVLVGTPFAKKYLLASGIYGIDQQKPQKPKLPTSGGIVVLFGFIFSITSFLTVKSFLAPSTAEFAELLAALNSVVIIALIGLVDDIHIDLQSLFSEEADRDVEIDLLENYEPPRTHLIWEKISKVRGNRTEDSAIHRRGLSQLYKMMFVLPAVLPLIAVGAGSWSMSFPVIGTVNWGVIYPLILLPLGLLFVANVVNMLAGTNGLSTGMGMIAAFGLGFYALINGKLGAAAIGLGLGSSLLAFFHYNRYPASILPGDSLTYLTGAALFSAMVVGNMERFGVFIFAPWFLEFFLKARSRFQARSWGVIQKDGSLRPHGEGTYSLTHPLMRAGLKENQITWTLMGLEAAVVAAGLLLFSSGLL